MPTVPACLPAAAPPPSSCQPTCRARRPSPSLQEKVAYLRAQAEMELQSAQQRLEQVEQQAAAARQAFTLHLDAATE